MQDRHGSCACGSVQISAASDDPLFVSMCHCLQCQKRTGSTYSVHAYFPREAVTVTGALTRFRRPGDTGCFVDFAFCPNCGSTMFWEVEADPDRIGIPVGVFADPAFPPPSVSVFSPHKHPWVSVPPGIPENEGHSAAFRASASAALAKRGASAI
jgi:hypothetical protein